MDRVRLVTFDCYGTLIDWRAGIRSAFHEHVPESRDIDFDALFAVFHEIQNGVEAGPYRPYREVLLETTRCVVSRFGWSLATAREGFLAEALPGWPPFPDTNPALERLAAAGLRRGILSNVDDDLLADTLWHLTIPFDVLVTAERVGCYKPAPAHFRRALEFVDGDPAHMIHVARSHYHDVQPAASLEIPVIWVNRQGVPPPESGPGPDVEVADLRAAVDRVLHDSI